MMTQLGLEPGLVAAVQSRLDAGQYTDAVKAAFLHLSDELRRISGRDGDGHDLVGQVLNINTPVIRLNRLQSESDKSEQKGWAELIRGLYTGIRNPRNHTALEDTEDWCMRVLVMVDAALKMLGKALPEFDVDQAVRRMLDPHFVEDRSYAARLASEIPQGSVFAVFKQVFEAHRHGNINKIRYAVSALVDSMSEEQRKAAGQMCSELLQIEQDENNIIRALATVPITLWTELDPAVQVRLENMMIEDIKKGSYGDTPAFGILASHLGGSVGQLGRLAAKFGVHFRAQKRLVEALRNRLSVDWYSQNYIGVYFLDALPALVKANDDVIDICERLSYAALGNGAREIQKRLGEAARHYPPWWKTLLLEKLGERAHNDRATFERIRATMEG